MGSHFSRSVFCAGFAIILAVALAGDVAAKEKYLPLPTQVVAARTVYIDNQTGVSKVGDQCYQEIQKWGRLQVVQDRKQADLILLLSYSVTTTTVDENGTKMTSTSTSAASEGYTYLTLIDPKTGDSLWNDSKQRGSWVTGSDSAITRLIDELRKRIKLAQPPLKP